MRGALLIARLPSQHLCVGVVACYRAGEAQHPSWSCAGSGAIVRFSPTRQTWRRAIARMELAQRDPYHALREPALGHAQGFRAIAGDHAVGDPLLQLQKLRIAERSQGLLEL